MKTLLILLVFCLGCASSYNTAQPWNEIERINIEVNESGEDHCVKIAQEKQTRLKAIGVESSLAACFVEKDTLFGKSYGHMVLLVDGYILDNLDENIWAKDSSDYDWWKHEDGDVWRNWMGQVVAAPRGL